MKINLPALPYAAHALEPYISERTVDAHQRDYLKTYVTKLKDLVQGTKFANADLDTMIIKADGLILYNAAQIWNHTFYFSGINKRKEYKLDGNFIEALRHKFGSLNGFRDAIINKAVTMFGSGWIWLIIDEKGKLELIQEIDAESPLRKGMKPLLAIDLCEHAYYLDYPNRRIDYINSFLKLLDWEIIEKRYNQYNVKKGAKKEYAHAV